MVSCLNLNKEIKEGRFDVEHYRYELEPIISAGREIVVLDIDGVITHLEDGTESDTLKPEMLEWIKDKYPEHLTVFITGRVTDSGYIDTMVESVLPHSVIIYNDHNLGKSSRVLKEFCLKELIAAGRVFDYYDDRYDVIRHLFAKKMLTNIQKLSWAYKGESYELY